METTRQNKISRLIQKELSEIFLLQTKAMNGVLVSVSAVRISPDMSIARVYLSVFPSEKSQEIVKNINDNMKSIRFELGTRVRHQLRIIPEHSCRRAHRSLPAGRKAISTQVLPECDVFHPCGITLSQIPGEGSPDVRHEAAP